MEGEDDGNVLKLYEEMKLKMAAMEKMIQRKRKRDGVQKVTGASAVTASANSTEPTTAESKAAELKAAETTGAETSAESGASIVAKLEVETPATIPTKPAKRQRKEDDNISGDVMPASGVETNQTAAIPAPSNSSSGQINGQVKVEPQDGEEKASEQQELTEEEKLWEKVQADPADFDTWVSLASSLEQKDDYSFLRKVLRALLKEFPLCYGYWTKLAELEKRHGHPQLQLQTCGEGVRAARHCHEMWTYYCCIDIDAKDDELVAETRRRFEEAAEVVGNDFQAHTFWNKFLEFETLHEDYKRVARIYLRILATPLALLDEYYKKYQEFASSRPLDDLLTEEESKTFDPKSVEESEKFRKEIMGRHEQLYLRAKKVKDAVDLFENRVTRAYFHVKEVDVSDIANWHAYLDYNEKWVSQSPDRTAGAMKVYERCLVACANYPEFWIRYANFLAKTRGKDYENETRAVFERATKIFTKRQPEAFLEYAIFEETTGNVKHARELYEIVLSKIAPGLVEGVVNLANFERRQGSLENAARVYEEGLRASPKETISFLAGRAANFHWRVRGDIKQAQEILEDAVSQAPGDISLWFQYITFTASTNTAFEETKKIYERALSTDSSTSEDKMILAAHYLEFASNNASNAEELWKIKERFPNVSNLLVFTKRRIQAEDSTPAATGSEGKLVQATQSASASTTAVSSSTATAVNASAASSATGTNAQMGYTQQQAASYYQQYGYGYQAYPQGQYNYSNQGWAQQTQ